MRALASIVLLGIAFGATACGDERDQADVADRAQPARFAPAGSTDARADRVALATIGKLHDALKAGEPVPACGALASVVRRRMARSGPACVTRLRRFSNALAGGARRVAAPRVVDASLDGRHGTATIDLGVSTDAEVALVRHRGAWKLGDFLLPRLERNPTTARRAVRGGIPIVATGGDGHGRCPPIDARDRLEIVGGCTGHAFSTRIDLIARTAAGAYSLGGCGLSYTLLVDGKGHNWIYNITTGRSRLCLEVAACYRRYAGGRKSGGLPWEGQVHGNGDGDGTFHNHIDVCLETPFGRIKGSANVTMTPRRGGDGWEIVAHGVPIGTGAFDLDGTWTLELPGFAMREMQPTGGAVGF